MFLTPVDTFKTMLQVQGNAAFNLLEDMVKSGSVRLVIDAAEFWLI